MAEEVIQNVVPPATKLGRASRELVDAAQDELGELLESLNRAATKARAIEAEGKGVNGLSSTMKGVGNQLDEIIKTVEESGAKVASTMLHDSKPRIVERVNHAKAAEVVAARNGEVAP